MYRKNDLLQLARQLLVPIAVIALGLILLFSPDSASALLSRVVGWILTAAGVVVGISLLLGDRSRWVRQAITAGVLILAGAWLRANPLVIAAWAGRFVGLLLVIRSLPDLLDQGLADRRALVTTVLGVILFLVPMTTSRFLISLVGVVILCVGIAMLIDQLRHREPLEEGRPDIIDADE